MIRKAAASLKMQTKTDDGTRTIPYLDLEALLAVTRKKLASGDGIHDPRKP